jgi:hypothetical protein
VFDDISKDALLRHLSASSAWRVTQEAGAIVAHKCVFVKDVRMDNLSPDEEQSQLRVELRFSPYTRKTAWDPTKTDIVIAGVEKHTVRVEKSNSAGPNYGSFLLIKGSNGLFLQIREWNSSVARPLTQRAISDISKELRAIKEATAEIIRNGYAEKLMAKGSRLFQDEASLNIRETPNRQPGVYTIDGYINEREPGYITVHVYDAGDKSELIPTKSEMDSLEYVGWSESQNEKFYFSCELTIGSEKMGKKKDVVFTVTYHPTSIKKIISKKIAISTWSR